MASNEILDSLVQDWDHIKQSRDDKHRVRRRILRGDPLPLDQRLSALRQLYVEKCDIGPLLERQERVLEYHGVHQSSEWQQLKIRRALAIRVLFCEDVMNTDSTLEDFKTTYKFKDENIEMPYVASTAQLKFLAHEATTASTKAVEDYRSLLELHLDGKPVSATDREDYLDQDAWLFVVDFNSYLWAIICRDMFQDEYLIESFQDRQDVVAAYVRLHLFNQLKHGLKFQQFNIDHFILLGGDAKYAGGNDGVDDMAVMLSKATVSDDEDGDSDDEGDDDDSDDGDEDEDEDNDEGDEEDEEDDEDEEMDG